MGLVLGIDQGITSVGWGIIDTDHNTIVDAGVRLFPEAGKNDLNNEKRRSFRSSRRLKRRRSVKKEDLTKILKEFGLYSKYSGLNPYEIRVKGLNEKLSLEELNCALFHLAKHRGSSLETVEDNSNNADEASAKFNLSENDKLAAEGKYVCEIQLERLKANGCLRGNANNFRSFLYETELNKIMEVQEIDEQARSAISECIFRRRLFSEGPGSFKSQTPYGRIYNEDGSVKVDMIEKMTGYCSVYPEERRSPKMAPSAELFNLLNDLNNLRIDDEPIAVSVKQELFDQAFAKGSITPKAIAKKLNVNEKDISGFRIDKNDKQLVSELKGLKEFKKIFDNYGMSIKISDLKLLDKIATILTSTKVYKDRINQLSELIPDNNDLVEELALSTKFTGTHSLSLKAIYDLNEEMYNSEYNQMQILHLSNKFEFRRERSSQKGKKKIAINDEAILSPVALRSYRQAIKVINVARAKYGEFEAIVVETTRDKNSDERKKRINDTQKFYEARNKRVQEVMKNYPNIKLNGKLREKILLYEEQNCKTAYTQEPINLDTLINDEFAYEVDHIIPISISLDDSINNKTLCSHKENQDKGNLTPLMAFRSNKFKNGNEINYVAFVNSLKVSKKKRDNYLYAKDITKYENMKEFIARNLVDTSYANRLLFNTLNDYFSDNEIDTKVHTVKGFATNNFRKLLKLEKDRDLDHSHHAIDALLIAAIKKSDVYRKLLKDFSVSHKEIVYNKDTGEIVDNITDQLLDESCIKFIKEIGNYKSRNFSWMVDTKPNRSVANQTIYSTRVIDGDHQVVKRYKDIYAEKIATKYCPIADDIMNHEDDKYLMKKNDELTWSILVDVVNNYYEQFKKDPKMIETDKKGTICFKFNPFNLLIKENPDKKIRKYSKHGNGPIVQSVRYLDGKINSYVDISKNYNVADKKVVLLQVSPYRTDFYLDNGVYKFVTIRYKDVKFSSSDNKYHIDEEWYRAEKERKNISEEAKFLFSIHRNEIIDISSGKYRGLYRFTATNNDKTNIIEIKYIEKNVSGQLMAVVSSNTKYIRKYSCDALGELREITNTTLKLEFE